MVFFDHFVDDGVNLVTLPDELLLSLLSQRLFLLELFGHMDFGLLHLLEDLSLLLFLSEFTLLVAAEHLDFDGGLTFLKGDC